MNANSLLFTLCAACAMGPTTAFAQQGSTTKTSAPQPTATSATATNAKTGQIPAQTASTKEEMVVPPPGMEHPGYHPGPDFGYVYEGDCADGACYDHFGMRFSDWVCVPRLAHWGSIEYLLWWRKSEFLPPLVSNGPLDAANAEIFFGNGHFDFGPQPGGRVTAGVWFDDLECLGIGGRFWGLGEGEIDFQQTTPGGGALARPFIDANTGNPNAVNIAGALGGSIDIDTRSEIYGGDALFRKRIECGCNGRLDWVAGYQFSRLEEDIFIQTSTTLPPGPPTALNVFDRFSTKNEFHAGAIGLQAEIEYGRMVVGLLTKVGLGNMRETVVIAGGGNPANSGLQGLLAQNTNIGEFTQEHFAVAPEVNLNVGYRVTENFDVSVGYSMLYWSHVARPGTQIDFVVDTLPPVENRPRFEFDTTDFWVMGFNVGCQWSF